MNLTRFLKVASPHAGNLFKHAVISYTAKNSLYIATTGWICMWIYIIYNMNVVIKQLVDSSGLLVFVD